ncbi:MAG: sugar phosphate isomerase/epimerase [Lentisphaeria bacterium]|nr:sugar phosphate isomerase/epimerase [Lentisphaeria bacterium]
MYKALNYWVFGGFTGEKSPKEFIDFAVANGLDGIELTVGDAINESITEEECRAIAEYAKAKGVGLKTLATGKYGSLSLGAADEAERQEAIAFTKKYLQIAAWMDVKVILVIPGATCVAWEPSRPIVPYRTVWENSTKSLKELLPVAEKLGVTIALENVWTRFLLSPMEWRFFLDQFQSQYLGMYFDVGNCAILTKPQDYIDILGNRIKAVHLKNFKGTDCGGGLHGFGDDLLDGDVNMKDVIAKFEEVGYKDTFTVEMIPFSRLPDLILPDAALSQKMVEQLKSL